jgi:hypothetical protein
VSRPLRSALAGSVYGLALLFWAFTAAGSGHGSYLPAALVAAPFSSVYRFGAVSAPVLWAAIGYALGRRWAGVALVLLGIHAASAATNLAYGTPWETSDQQWEYLASAGRAFAIVFVWPGFVLHLVGVIVASTLALQQLGDEP